MLACLEKFARDNDLQNGIVSSFVGDIENVETVVGRVHGWFPRGLSPFVALKEMISSSTQVSRSRQNC